MALGTIGGWLGDVGGFVGGAAHSAGDFLGGVGQEAGNIGGDVVGGIETAGGFMGDFAKGFLNEGVDTAQSLWNLGVSEADDVKHNPQDLVTPGGPIAAMFRRQAEGAIEYTVQHPGDSFVGQVVQHPNEAANGVEHGLDQVVTDFEKHPGDFSGRAAFEIAGMFVGAGEVSAALKGERGLAAVSRLNGLISKFGTRFAKDLLKDPQVTAEQRAEITNVLKGVDSEDAKPPAAGSASQDAPGAGANARGHAYEDFLVKHFNGTGSFKEGGREFDGRAGNNWWEAKSGQYWTKDVMGTEGGLGKFKSDIGQRAAIAKQHGATFSVYSNTPIPPEVQAYLNKKGIPFEVIKNQ